MDAEAGPSGGGAAAGPAGGFSAAALDWRFGQVFGERTPGDEVQDGARREACPNRSRGELERRPAACSSARARPHGRGTRLAPAHTRGCACLRRLARAWTVLWGGTHGCFDARPGVDAATLRDRLTQPPSPPSAADIISAVEFDATGAQLATGDRGGRVVLFEQVDARAEQARCAPTLGGRVRRARAPRGCAGRCGEACTLLPGTPCCSVAATRRALHGSGAPPPARERDAARLPGSAWAGNRRAVVRLGARVPRSRQARLCSALPAAC